MANPPQRTEGLGQDSANRLQDARPFGRFFGEPFFRLAHSGLSKPARRCVSEALYGIAARGAVRLSEIGRALEETIALAKTETRLSRNLGRPELRANLGAAVLRQGGARIGARTLLVLDISDIAKPYAEKMQYLTRVPSTNLVI